MTLNVVTLPVSNLRDIPTQAREFADRVEAGEFGDVTAVMVLIEGPGLDLAFWGEGMSHVEGIGTLEVAKAKLVRDIVGE